MKYTVDLQSALNDPRKLEELYQRSKNANDEAEFRLDLQSEYEKSPENLVLAAWQARFEHQPLSKPKRTIQWGLAVILGIITGLILWAISDPNLIFMDQLPFFIFLWAPIATIPAIIFLTVVSKKNYLYAGLVIIALVIASVFILLIAPTQSHNKRIDYLTLMVAVLPLLCWFGLGITTLKFSSMPDDRFAFLIKSIEVMITAGVYLIFGMIFGGITFGMFSALNVTLPELVMRLAIAGGFGIIPILAIASMYDPHYAPKAQDFSLGLSKFVFTVVRLLLPLSVLVLLIYIFVIPFNFMAPFKNRDLLIIYNVMQFAIIGMLIGATPLKVDDLSEKLQIWLRRGIIAVAILALIISLYAFSAVIYRTAQEYLTINRTTIIGWNVINIAILVAVVVSQLKRGFTGWHIRLQNLFSRSTTAYLVWSIFLIIALPLFFR